MKFALRLTLIIMTLAILGVSVSFAQRGPRASQRGYVEQTVGTMQLKITYHRPNIKGRVLWGDKDALVPNGKVWRAGANEATVIEFTEDVMINGKSLAAGKYSFYAIPTNEEWTLMFNKTWEQWGTIYDEKFDALRISVKPAMSSESKESLAYLIENVEANSAEVVLAWGKARVGFNVASFPSVPAAEPAK